MNLFVDLDTNRVSIHVWSHLSFPFLLATSCISPPSFLPVLSTGHFLDQTWERKIRILERGGKKKCLMDCNEEIIFSCTFCINQWFVTPRHESGHLIVTVHGPNAMPRLRFTLPHEEPTQGHKEQPRPLGPFHLPCPGDGQQTTSLSFLLCSFRKESRETQGKINAKGSLSKCKVSAVEDAAGRDLD